MLLRTTSLHRSAIDLNLRLPMKSDDSNQWLASAYRRCAITRIDIRAEAVVARKQIRLVVLDTPIS